MILLHFNIRGHNITGIVGGATGSVGDPSGRTTERSSMDDAVRLDNVSRIKTQLEHFFTNGVRYVKSISTTHIDEGMIKSMNNYDWWKDITFLEFLARYGRHIRVGQMISRDSVRNRLESESGIGFNEFAYQVLQAFDFYHLFEKHEVSVQVGGHDQWGNITAGIDFINRLKTTKKDPFGITVPLLTTSSGAKFGKSAGNAVFIDPSITPIFELYQYFMKIPDDQVEKLLKIFTFLPLEQIQSIIERHFQDPAYRNAQRVLANEITDLIHGVGTGKDASIISQILYPLPDIAYPDISSNELIQSFKNANILRQLDTKYINQPYSAIVSELHGCSKKEAKKLVGNGGIYLGYERLKLDQSDSLLLTRDQLIDGKVLLLRVGKAKYYVAEVV
jgi:tyrosyl-tRNA synthetase